MRRLITILAIVLACANASGQGKIMFGNDSNHLFTLYLSPIPMSPLLNGHTLKAVLYAGTTTGSLALQTSVVLDASGWLTDGRMVNKNLVLANIPGGTPAHFQIFVTDMGTVLPGTIVGGANYFSGSTYLGTSGLFTAIPGTSINFPSLATAASASTWAAGNIEIGCLGCIPPFFMVNPSNSVVRLGHDVTLNALASDYSFPAPVRYQWRKQSVPIAGATNNYLTLTNVTMGNAGSYDVLASNAYGSRPSAVATVTVLVPAVLGSPAYTDNQFQFTVTGAPGTNYIVQVSTNLLTSQWVSVFTNAAPFTFIDTDTTGHPRRFYRAYSP